MQQKSNLLVPRPSLRERKKKHTRAVLAETAKALFDERGFDNVTVAEIADAANVSVKTMFKYFDSKEDLLFSNENEFRDQILAMVRERKPGESALDSIRHFFGLLVKSPGHRVVINEVEGLRRSFGSNAALQGRLTLMWERYEVALAEILRDEAAAEPRDPTPRLVAAQLISLFRLLTSEDLREYLQSQPVKARSRALDRWLAASLELVGGGVRHYAKRPVADEIG